VNLKVRVSALPIPPGDYKREDFNQIIRKLNQLMDNVFNPGDLVATKLIFIGIAQSGYGLEVGEVFVDANGFLKLVRSQDIFAPSFAVRTKLHAVTVT
jgi:hypothetical protein